jgi:exodeoxyribonuclease VII small subunit
MSAEDEDVQPGLAVDGDAAEAHDYETAAARVEEIVRRLDSGEAGLRETLALVSEGRTLIEFCAAELAAVSGELESLRLDELVAQLEAASGAR